MGLFHFIVENMGLEVQSDRLANLSQAYTQIPAIISSHLSGPSAPC